MLPEMRLRDLRVISLIVRCYSHGCWRVVEVVVGGVEREMKELFEALLVTMTMLLQSRADRGDNYPDN